MLEVGLGILLLMLAAGLIIPLVIGAAFIVEIFADLFSKK